MKKMIIRLSLVKLFRFNNCRTEIDQLQTHLSFAQIHLITNPKIILLCHLCTINTFRWIKYKLSFTLSSQIQQIPEFCVFNKELLTVAVQRITKKYLALFPENKKRKNKRKFSRGRSNNRRNRTCMKRKRCLVLVLKPNIAAKWYNSSITVSTPCRNIKRFWQMRQYQEILTLSLSNGSLWEFFFTPKFMSISPPSSVKIPGKYIYRKI